MIHEQRPDRAELHRFNRPEECVVAPNGARLDYMAVDRHRGCGENRAAGCKNRPGISCKPISAPDARATGEEISRPSAAVAQSVDAEDAIFQHNRIRLTAP